jgi:hypothetical protein
MNLIQKGVNEVKLFINGNTVIGALLKFIDRKYIIKVQLDKNGYDERK